MFTLIVTYHNLVANILIGVSIMIMSGAILRSFKLMNILKDRKVENIWKRSQLLIIILTLLFLIIMITRLIGSNTSFTDLFDDGPNHSVIMNFAFLLMSLFTITVVTLDIKAFKALYEIIENHQHLARSYQDIIDS